MNSTLKRSGLAALIALTVLVSMVATPVAAAGGIGWNADTQTLEPLVGTRGDTLPGSSS